MRTKPSHFARDRPSWCVGLSEVVPATILAKPSPRLCHVDKARVAIYNSGPQSATPFISSSFSSLHYLNPPVTSTGQSCFTPISTSMLVVLSGSPQVALGRQDSAGRELLDASRLFQDVAQSHCAETRRPVVSENRDDRDWTSLVSAQ